MIFFLNFLLNLFNKNIIKYNIIKFIRFTWIKVSIKRKSIRYQISFFFHRVYL